MAKEKQSPDTVAAKKPAAKKSPAKKTAVKKTSAKKAAPKGAGAAAISQDELMKEISVRAFEIYCGRGGEHGSHEDDWHRAEREIRAKYNL